MYLLSSILECILSGIFIILPISLFPTIWISKGLDFDFDFDFNLIGKVSLTSSRDNNLLVCELRIYTFLVFPILINKVMVLVELIMGMKG